MPEFDIDAALHEPPQPPPDGKVVDQYDVIDIGIENGQYFRGFGRGRYEESFVGTGDNPSEAFQDALEQAAAEGWNVDNVETIYANVNNEEWSVSRRNRAEWEAHLDLEATGLADIADEEERKEEMDALWQEECDRGDHNDIAYYVGLRVSSPGWDGD